MENKECFFFFFQISLGEEYIIYLPKHDKLEEGRIHKPHTANTHSHKMEGNRKHKIEII